ncbi:hypothetical protein YB2330_004323 [Saitoella coloradoensis]
MANIKVAPFTINLGEDVNLYDVYCPYCLKSIILKAGVGKKVERDAAPLSRVSDADKPEPSAPSEATAHFWEVNDPFAFENLGFSKDDPARPNLKYLACADCDKGPLGYADRAANEYLLAVEMVGYKIENA